jgi:hypothetical protein
MVQLLTTAIPRLKLKQPTTQLQINSTMLRNILLAQEQSSLKLKM